jgi:acyl-CoA-binding protein
MNEPQVQIKTPPPAVIITASDFRKKVSQMKSWMPHKIPTNRDRLELYALHKQAVASDAPSTLKVTKSSSPAERAKLNAWKTKRGLTQSQAMAAYCTEADRQFNVYGTAGHTGSGGSGSGSNSKTYTTTQTPIHTPMDHHSDDGASTSTASASASASVLLTPRGLAAVPLLCAAASEPRSSYLKRLENTIALSSNKSNGNGNDSDNDNSHGNGNETVGGGWWSRQEALCGDPDTIFCLPETILLTTAIFVEQLSLSLASNSTWKNTLDTFRIKPTVLQSLLWPLHNVLLVIWIEIIFGSTCIMSAIILLKTMFMGSKRTGVTISTIFSQEIRPCRRGTGSLCVPHQPPTVRLLGLILYPLGMICALAEGVVDVVVPYLGENTALLVGSGTYVVVMVMLSWYWFLVLPWMTIGSGVLAIGLGWCFGLIELAKM